MKLKMNKLIILLGLITLCTCKPFEHCFRSIHCGKLNCFDGTIYRLVDSEEARHCGSFFTDFGHFNENVTLEYSNGPVDLVCQEGYRYNPYKGSCFPEILSGYDGWLLKNGSEYFSCLNKGKHGKREFYCSFDSVYLFVENTCIRLPDTEICFPIKMGTMKPEEIMGGQPVNYEPTSIVTDNNHAPISLAPERRMITNINVSTSRKCAKVINGIKVESNGYIMALFKGSSFVCTSFAVGSQSVLTAAHCIDRDQIIHYSVCYGTNVFNMTQCYAIVGHGKTKYDPSTFQNDIIELYTREKLSVVYCGEFKVPQPDDICQAYGYGSTTWGGNEYGTLYKTQNMKYVSDCSKIPGHHCFYSKSSDACQGDSGGPLICNGTIKAITSWGKGCGVEPGRYQEINYEQSKYVKEADQVDTYVPVDFSLTEMFVLPVSIEHEDIRYAPTRWDIYECLGIFVSKKCYNDEFNAWFGAAQAEQVVYKNASNVTTNWCRGDVQSNGTDIIYSSYRRMNLNCTRLQSQYLELFEDNERELDALDTVLYVVNGKIKGERITRGFKSFDSSHSVLMGDLLFVPHERFYNHSATVYSYTAFPCLEQKLVEDMYAVPLLTGNVDCETGEKQEQTMCMEWNMNGKQERYEFCNRERVTIPGDLIPTTDALEAGIIPNPYLPAAEVYAWKAICPQPNLIASLNKSENMYDLFFHTIPRYTPHCLRSTYLRREYREDQIIEIFHSESPARQKRSLIVDEALDITNLQKANLVLEEDRDKIVYIQDGEIRVKQRNGCMIFGDFRFMWFICQNPFLVYIIVFYVCFTGIMFLVVFFMWCCVLPAKRREWEEKHVLRNQNQVFLSKHLDDERLGRMIAGEEKFSDDLKKEKSDSQKWKDADAVNKLAEEAKKKERTIKKIKTGKHDHEKGKTWAGVVVDKMYRAPSSMLGLSGGGSKYSAGKESLSILIYVVLLVFASASYRGCSGSCKPELRTGGIDDLTYEIPNKTFAMFLYESSTDYKLGDASEFDKPFTAGHFVPTSDERETIVEAVYKEDKCQYKGPVTLKQQYTVGTVLKLIIKCKIGGDELILIKYIRIEGFDLEVKSEYDWTTSTFNVRPYHFPLTFQGAVENLCLNVTHCAKDSETNKGLYLTEKIKVPHEAYQEIANCEVHNNPKGDRFDMRAYRFEPNNEVMTHVFKATVDKTRLFICVLDDATQIVSCNYADQLGIIEYVDATMLSLDNIAVTTAGTSITDVFPVSPITYSTNTIMGGFGDLKYKGFTSGTNPQVLHGRVSLVQVPRFYDNKISSNAPNFWQYKWRCDETKSQDKAYNANLARSGKPMTPAWKCKKIYLASFCPLDAAYANEYKSDHFQNCDTYFSCLQRYNFLISQDPNMKFMHIPNGVMNPSKKFSGRALVPLKVRVKYKGLQEDGKTFYQPVFESSYKTGSSAGTLTFSGKLQKSETQGDKSDIKSIEIAECNYRPMMMLSNCTVTVTAIRTVVLRFTGEDGITMSSTRVFEAGTVSKFVGFTKAYVNQTDVKIAVVMKGDTIFTITTTMITHYDQGYYSDYNVILSQPKLTIWEIFDYTSIWFYVVVGSLTFLLFFIFCRQRKTYNRLEDGKRYTPDSISKED